MDNATPNLLGTWKVAPAERQQREQAIAAQRGTADAQTLAQMESALELWNKLELKIDDTKIVGDLGDGTSSHRYAVKDRWTAADGLQVIDLELHGSGAPRTVSVLFLAPDKVMFQGQELRLPLQRV